MTSNFSPVYNFLWLPCALGELPEPALPPHWSHHSSSPSHQFRALLVCSQRKSFPALAPWLVYVFRSQNIPLERAFHRCPLTLLFYSCSLFVYFRICHNYKLPPPTFFISMFLSGFWTKVSASQQRWCHGFSRHPAHGLIVAGIQ